MSRKDEKVAKGNWKHVDGGMAFIVPVTLLRHTNWIRMRAHAIKLVFDLGRQYSGLNNGYLCAAWELMKDKGWKSRETLYIAIAEAEHYNIITKTRQGGRNRSSLYALTWWQIHTKKDNPLDIGPTLEPSNKWKEEVPDFELPEWLQKHRTKLKEKSKRLHVLRAA